jgi:fructose-bisphosphate aldolase class I
MDGAHTIERCFEVTEKILQRVFHRLFEHRICLAGMLLKPNMVIAGADCPQQASVAQVAEATLRCLKQIVPTAVPGIVFLSGGQSETLATENLNALNQLGNAPWKLSFSFGRALQASAMKTWKGERKNFSAAQEALLHRARCNSVACHGKYSKQMESAQK